MGRRRVVSEQALRACVLSGLTVAEAAEDLGVSEGAVRSAEQAFGWRLKRVRRLRPNRTAVHGVDLDKLRKLTAGRARQSVQDLASELGVSCYAVAGTCRRLGIEFDSGERRITLERLTRASRERQSVASLSQELGVSSLLLLKVCRDYDIRIGAQSTYTQRVIENNSASVAADILQVNPEQVRLLRKALRLPIVKPITRGLLWYVVACVAEHDGFVGTLQYADWYKPALAWGTRNRMPWPAVCTFGLRAIHKDWGRVLYAFKSHPDFRDWATWEQLTAVSDTDAREKARRYAARAFRPCPIGDPDDLLLETQKILASQPDAPNPKVKLTEEHMMRACLQDLTPKEVSEATGLQVRTIYAAERRVGVHLRRFPMIPKTLRKLRKSTYETLVRAAIDGTSLEDVAQGIGVAPSNLWRVCVASEIAIDVGADYQHVGATEEHLLAAERGGLTRPELAVRLGVGVDEVNIMAKAYDVDVMGARVRDVDAEREAETREQMKGFVPKRTRKKRKYKPRRPEDKFVVTVTPIVET